MATYDGAESLTDEEQASLDRLVQAFGARREPLEWSIAPNYAEVASIIISDPRLWRSGDVVMLLEATGKGTWRALDRYSREDVLAEAESLAKLARVLTMQRKAPPAHAHR